MRLRRLNAATCLPSSRASIAFSFPLHPLFDHPPHPPGLGILPPWQPDSLRPIVQPLRELWFPAVCLLPSVWPEWPCALVGFLEPLAIQEDRISLQSLACRRNLLAAWEILEFGLKLLSG